MSIAEATTPSSTTGSTAASPAASGYPPVTPLTPNSAISNLALPGGDGDSANSPNAGTAPAQNSQAQQPAAPPKRKPSRRANTAERRATHNAVERQRRETLNGRFLDLAALLPNLATVRRPSKSAIVNSSIALIHSARRQRLVAAREARLLKLEADALRRELNEWRARAQLPRVDEPQRAPECLALLSLGLVDGEGYEGGEGQWWGGDAMDMGEMGEEERRAYELVMREADGDDDGIIEEGDEEYTQRPMSMGGFKGNNNGMGLAHIMPRGVPSQQAPQMSFARGSGNMFDGAGMPSHPALGAGVHTMYEPNGHPHGHSHALPVHPNFALGLDAQSQSAAEKIASAWGAPGATQGMFQQQGMGGNVGVAQPQWAHQLSLSPVSGQPNSNNAQALFTPPGTAGGNNGAPTSAAGVTNPFGQTLFGGMGQQQQQQQMNLALGHGHVYASPELDDASSVGSVDGQARSVGGSPGPQGTTNGFDMALGGMYGRKPNLTLNMPGDAHGQWPAPVTVGTGGGMSGGGRHLNAMMSMMM